MVVPMPRREEDPLVVAFPNLNPHHSRRRRAPTPPPTSGAQHRQEPPMGEAWSTVNEARQWGRLMAMARDRRLRWPGGRRGVNRAALTPLDRKARRLLIAWAAPLGLPAVGGPARQPVPAAGGHRPGRRAGAHRQPHGHPAERRAVRRHLRRGRGAGGGAGDARGRRRAPRAPDRDRGLDQRGRRPLRPRLHGQHGLCRAPADAWDCAVTDPDGVRFARRAPRATGRREPTCRAGARGGRGRAAAPHAYVEAHIEQGPRLDAEGRDIGVVTGIQGSRWFVVEADRRNRACRHRAALLPARRGAGHDPRDQRAERADARPDGRAALHRRPDRGGAEHLEHASPTACASPSTSATPTRRAAGERGDAIEATVQRGGARLRRGGRGALHRPCRWSSARR